MKPIFCNKCRKRITSPKFLLDNGTNIQGNIKLKCSDNKCNGEVLIKPKDQ
jgi:hypothetical protein